jgi:hypothetical protein
MQILQESFERMVTGSTVTGLAAFTHTDSDRGIDDSAEFAVEVVAVERADEDSRWSLQLLPAPNGNGGEFWIDAEVHWGHSSPLVIVENQKVPTIGSVSARFVIYNHTVAGGWRSGEQQGTFHGTIQPRLMSAQHGTYVIERTGDMNRDWWTGAHWSENPRDAKWYDYEPHAGSEAEDEGAHTIYYPTGKIDH